MAKIYKLIRLVKKGIFEKSFGTIAVELNKHYSFKRKSIVSNLVVVELEGVAGYQVNPSTLPSSDASSRLAIIHRRFPQCILCYSAPGFPIPFEKMLVISKLTDAMEVASTLVDAVDNTSAPIPDQDIDIPSSPPLPSPRCLAFPFTVGRKRPREDYLPTSSDVPMFSSDDASISAENYLQQRNKRQYRGPWWNVPVRGTGSEPLPRKKREFKRTVDSGVWMGSDETNESEEQLGDENVPSTLQDRQNTEVGIGNEYNFGFVARRLLGDIPVFARPLEQERDLEATSEAQTNAFNRIQQCVDTGLEIIDLS